MFQFNTFRKTFINPYRSGVKIGNYNEDLFGKELQDKYKIPVRVDPNNYTSEFTAKYKWPEPRPNDIKMRANHITNTNTMNFDLNIDFNKQNFDDYMKIYRKNELNPYILEDKNLFTEEQYKIKQQNNHLDQENSMPFHPNVRQRPQSARVYSHSYKNKNPILGTGYEESPYGNTVGSIKDAQQDLMQSHVTDMNGIFNTTNGVKPRLIYGHGPCQKKFTKGDYATMYDLTLCRKEKTDKVLNPKYKLVKDFQHQPNPNPDKTDWNFRNYKIMGEFTRKFDKPNNQINRTFYGDVKVRDLI